MVKAPAAVPIRQKRGFLGLTVATVDTLRFIKWRQRIVLISMAIVNGGFADAPDLGLRNHRFQSVAFHFKANAFYEWKQVFRVKSSRSRMVSRMRLILAQILAHRHARLRLMRVSTFRPLPTENAAIAHGLRNSRSSPQNHPELCLPVPQKPELRSYVNKLAGTFNWRKVAGTERLSNHSFATAIDLNVDKAALAPAIADADGSLFAQKLAD
jgi:hypothetical protein